MLDKKKVREEVQVFLLDYLRRGIKMIPRFKRLHLKFTIVLLFFCFFPKQIVILPEILQDRYECIQHQIFEFFDDLIHLFFVLPLSYGFVHPFTSSLRIRFTHSILWVFKA